MYQDSEGIYHRQFNEAQEPKRFDWAAWDAEHGRGGSGDKGESSGNKDVRKRVSALGKGIKADFVTGDPKAGKDNGSGEHPSAGWGLGNKTGKALDKGGKADISHNGTSVGHVSMEKDGTFTAHHASGQKIGGHTSFEDAKNGVVGLHMAHSFDAKGNGKTTLK